MEITLLYQKSRPTKKLAMESGHVTNSYKDESDARSHRPWNVVGWAKGDRRWDLECRVTLALSEF